MSVIVNTGDDEHFYGLHVSPDVDTVIYTLAGVINRAIGWGLEGESFNALDALGRLYGKPWFNAGRSRPRDPSLSHRAASFRARP